MRNLGWLSLQISGLHVASLRSSATISPKPKCHRYPFLHFCPRTPPYLPRPLLPWPLAPRTPSPLTPFPRGPRAPSPLSLLAPFSLSPLAAVCRGYRVLYIIPYNAKLHAVCEGLY